MLAKSKIKHKITRTLHSVLYHLETQGEERIHVVSGYNYGGTGVGTRAGGGGKLRIYNGAQGERIRNKQGAKEEEGKHDIC